MLQNRSFKRQLIETMHREGLLDSGPDLQTWLLDMESYEKQVESSDLWILVSLFMISG